MEDRNYCAGEQCAPTSPDTGGALPSSARGRAYKIRGMDCAEEVGALRQALNPIVGNPDNLTFDVLNGRLVVGEGARDVPDDRILQAVASTGMAATPWQTEATDAIDRDEHGSPLLFTVASGLCLAVGFILHVLLAGGFNDVWSLLSEHTADAAPWPEIAAYVGAVVFGGRFVVVKAWYSAKNLRPDINLLMVIAVIGAMAIGQWFEAATVSFLFSLSLTLESWSVGRARRAIAALLTLAPDVVRLVQPGAGEAEVPVGEAKIGDVFFVPAGERIALDGQVVGGMSAVNQAPITGESVPVEKEPGSIVFAGTINGDGELTVKVSKLAGDSTLARIIRMVEDAQARRAPSEQWVERFARIYTPVVIVLALLIFLVPVLLGGDWQEWFYRALVLLVIACPCALVISTPVSIVASLASAARAGVLIKGGAFVELPARIKAIAFDKTGTITRGEPEVVRLIPFNGHSEVELLSRAAALESRSSHPLARAIMRYAKERGIAEAPASNIQILKGKGLSGTFNGESFWLGSSRYVAERGQVSDEITREAESLEGAGKTVILIGNERHVCGLIAVEDTVRSDAAAVIAALRATGVHHVVMLSGDNKATAQNIAKKVGIDEVRAELLPEEKVAAIEELVVRYETVAMVGDGVNDAPALARASLGIAMGAMGSDAAIETADIALMTDDLSKLPWLVRHSRATLGVIRQNIALSLGIKAVFFVLTFAGIATLWGAIAADVGASLLVVFNSLRLLKRT